ncbi:hypothetical protein DFH09DRAFT_1270824 [Mycena vulgaris]|nr:hypothetical protein DFH09DRAFT_1270824 [Mycena vulgaris]
MPPATEIRLNNILKCFTIAVDSLEVLAKTFKNPFLEPISNTAKSLLNAVQTVRQNKSDFAQLLEETYGLLCAIVSLHMKLEAGPDMSPSMLNDLGKFTDTLYKIHTFVEAQQDKSKIRHFFRQGEMNRLFKNCNLGLQEALNNFKVQDINLLTEVIVMQKFAEERHQEVLELIEAFSDGTVSDKGSLHRFFVSCDTASTKDELVTLIGAHLGLKPKKDLAKVILHHFATNPTCLLVLDNLETLWELTEIRGDIEELLSLLTDIKHLGLIITMRGTERPASVRWTRPFLPALKPLTQDAARQTFIDIADDCHNSDDIDKVLLLTGNMPLAIDLMAHLVESEGCPMVLARWEEEKTSYIELVQSKLPIKDILSCKAVLLSTSLAYSDDQRRFKVLVPIREYMARSSPPMDYLVQSLLNYFHQLLEVWYKYSGTVSASEMLVKITSNWSNIQGLLLSRLQSHTPVAVDLVSCVVYLNAFSRLAGRGWTPLMDHIAQIQSLPSELEVCLITEIFSSWSHYPVLNPEALVDKVIKQLPHFDDSDIKYSTGLYYQNHNNAIPMATKYFDTALSLAVSTGNTNRQCQSSVNLANLKWHTGNPAAGQMYAAEAERLAKISTNLYNEAQALWNQAMCWHSLGKYNHATSLCSRARDLLAHCGMSGGILDFDIMVEQGETHKLKSEYVEARNITGQILDGNPMELAPLEHAITSLNIAELDLLLGAPTDQVQRTIDTAKSISNSINYSGCEIICDALMGALHLREGDLKSAKSLFHKCLSSSWGNYTEILNFCLERLGDRSLWNSTDWSWTTVYLVHASKSQQRLDVHKALQFLADFFRAEGDQDTAVSLLTVALEGFTQMDVHHSRAECMLGLGYISKENGDLLKTAELWRTARPLFERSSQVKKVALIDEGLLSIAGDVLDEHTRSLALLSDTHAPNAAPELTVTSLLEEIGERSLGEEKELVPV